MLWWPSVSAAALTCVFLAQTTHATRYATDADDQNPLQDAYDSAADQIPLQFAEFEALSDLHAQTNGNKWKISWTLDAHSKESMCSAHGILCKNGSIAIMDLNSVGLTGQLPDSLGLLANLEKLDLGGNSITGTIPKQLGKLSKLRYLDIGSSRDEAANQLTGSIPAELGQLKYLEELELGSNRLEGPLPTEIGYLANLRKLHLGYNKLSGDLPDSLWKLRELEVLDLSHNHFTGEVSERIGRLTNLNALRLQENHFTGPIPRKIGKLKKLEERLSLDTNQFTGEIPGELGFLPDLMQLRLNDNNLTGPIPVEFQLLRSLKYLNLSNNGLSGTIPQFLGKCNNDLFKVEMAGNDFSCPLTDYSCYPANDFHVLSSEIHCRNPSTANNGTTTSEIVGYSAAVLGTLVVLVCLAECYRRRRKIQYELAYYRSQGNGYVAVDPPR